MDIVEFTGTDPRLDQTEPIRATVFGVTVKVSAESGMSTSL